jgi:hypothetical protein
MPIGKPVAGHGVLCITNPSFFRDFFKFFFVWWDWFSFDFLTSDEAVTVHRF